MHTIVDGYAVIDAETTVKNLTIGTNKAHWASPDNCIVTFCSLRNTDSKVKSTYSKLGMKFSPAVKFKRLYVGHNIRFDILHLRKGGTLGVWLKEGRIWDTAHVEYLLSGQTHKFPSLDELSKKYGLPLKDDRLKTMWESGMQTEDMPEEILVEYCKQDVDNTHKIFLKQLEEVERRGMQALVKSQMDALMGLMEMEWNGMYIDTNGLEEYKHTIEARVNTLELDIKEYITTHTPIDILDANPNSLEHLNLLLFGGAYTHTIKVPMTDADGNAVLYKSGAKKGEPRYKNVEETVPCKGLEILIEPDHEMTSQGLFKLDDDILQKYLAHYNVPPLVSKTPEIYTVIDTIIQYRQLNKELSTYIEGYSKFIWPSGFIHPNFNTTLTATGRLSSSQPNMQNITRADD